MLLIYIFNCLGYFAFKIFIRYAKAYPYWKIFLKAKYTPISIKKCNKHQKHYVIPSICLSSSLDISKDESLGSSNSKSLQE